MSLLDVLHSGIKIADKITKPLQGTVQYRRSTTTDEYGPVVPTTSVPLKAIIEYRAVQVRTQEGTLATTRAIITLLDIPTVESVTAGKGVKLNDVFILPDGSTGPILDVTGFTDAITGHPLPTTVLLG